MIFFFRDLLQIKQINGNIPSYSYMPKVLTVGAQVGAHHECFSIPHYTTVNNIFNRKSYPEIS